MTARCRRMGRAEQTLRTAAILGPRIDLDLLAGVLHEQAVDVLGHLEKGENYLLLEEMGTTFVFRHEAVREALVVGTGAARRALVHREAARLLNERFRREAGRDVDAMAIAVHARLGGEMGLAALALVDAASIASSRFDHGEAERLLDESLSLGPTPAAYVARARVRLTRENFAGAIADATAAIEFVAGDDVTHDHDWTAAASDVAGWAAYYQRDFPRARECVDRILALSGPGSRPNAVRAGALALAGRIEHAAGNLVAARGFLSESVRTEGTEPTVHSGALVGVWLSLLLLDLGEVERAVEVSDLRETRPSSHMPLSAHPFGVAHRASLRAYAAGLQGRIDEALAHLDDLDREVERRRLDHMSGRSLNYRAWLLRNVLGGSEPDELNAAAREIAVKLGLQEPQVHSVLDLADGHLRRGDLAEAQTTLDRSVALGVTGFAFAWHAGLRHRLLRARLALADHRLEEATHLAASITEDATGIGMQRYVVLAELLGYEARALGGSRINHELVDRCLAELDRLAVPEAWWVTAQMASACGVDKWWKAAEARVAHLAAGCGERSDSFVRQAGARLDKMRTVRTSG